MPSDATREELIAGLPPGILSPQCVDILRSAPAGAYESLVVSNNAAKTPGGELLRGVTPEDLLAKPVRAADEARSLVSALWLWHDRLDESHTISQGIESPTGSFWHAIMHRREGDFSNSKYWYARCRHHPALAEIATKVGPVWSQLSRDSGAREWSPDAFVELVERIQNGKHDGDIAAAVTIQRLEWQALFAHCARSAV